MNAVFLSYASQDAEAARRICEALRAGGIEVWFDQSELRGGEAWDASIRRQIKSCRLFMAIISANTQEREEGYFRREWNLAVGRTLDMAEDKAFLLPVVIDATRDADARVPEKFREVQWTRLPGGETPASFVERVRALASKKADSASVEISPQPAVIADANRSEKRPASRRSMPGSARGIKLLKIALPVLLLLGAALIVIPPWIQKERARSNLVPAIEDAAAKMVRSNRKIFDMAVTAEKYLPKDPALAKLWPSIATTMSIDTEPAGAEIYWKDYDTPAAEWRFSGVSPLKEVKVPRDYLRLEIRKPGYQTIELAMPSFALGIRPIVQHLKMDPLGSLPENMVRIPKSTTDMEIVGLEKYGPKEVPEFLIDKFEVTNRQFKAFMDAGGYTNSAYWTFPIVEGGKVIPLEPRARQIHGPDGSTGTRHLGGGKLPRRHRESPGDRRVLVRGRGLCGLCAQAVADRISLGGRGGHLALGIPDSTEQFQWQVDECGGQSRQLKCLRGL